MNALPDIQPGDVAVHVNGELGRVLMPPAQKDMRIRVAFWLEDDETGNPYDSVMEMAWDLHAVDHVERDGVIVRGRGLEVQLGLWDEVA